MNKFDDAVKKALSQPQTPPFDSWDAIADGLDSNKKKRKRIIPLFYWISGISASVILCVTLYTYVYEFEEPLNNRIVLHQKKKAFDSVERLSDSLNLPLATAKQKMNSFDSGVNRTSIKKNEQTIESEQLLPLLTTTKYHENNPLNSTKVTTVEERLKETVQEENVIRPETHLNKDKNTALLNRTHKIDESLLAVAKEDKISEEPLYVLEDQTKQHDEVSWPKKVKAGKVSLSPFVAPSQMVNHSSLLANEMNNYSKSNTPNIAYGAKVSYALSDKVSLRSGISVLNAGQETKNVPITYQAMNSSALSSTPSPSYNIRYTSENKVSTLENSMPHVAVTNHKNRLEQRLQYIEIPVEMEYRLFALHKLKLSTTLGGSSLWLTENSIYLSENNSTLHIGEATNLNKVSFSGNLGMKLDYQLSNSTFISLEPGLKYLMNSVSDVDRSQPLLFGVAVGLSIQLNNKGDD